MSVRLEQTFEDWLNDTRDYEAGNHSQSKFEEESVWSGDCTWAPWWLGETPKLRMGEFIRELVEESEWTPDMASLCTMNEQLMFVYGTLKRGRGAHDLLEGSSFLGRGWTTLQTFKMVEGDYPVVLRADQDGPLAKSVQGEVYKVPVSRIKGIDRFEGNGSLYKRVRMSVEMETGKSRVCWMYLGIPSVFTALTKLAPSYTRKKGGTSYYTYNGK